MESSHNYEQIAVSPDGSLLFAINEGTVNISRYNKFEKNYIFIEFFFVSSRGSRLNQFGK